MEIKRGIQSHSKPEIWEQYVTIVINFNIQETVNEEGDTIFTYDSIESRFSEEVTKSFWLKVLKEDLVSDRIETALVVASLSAYCTLDGLQDIEPILTASYKELRRLEYPPIEDYVDALVKEDSIALNEYRIKCLAVKDKYPKAS